MTESIRDMNVIIFLLQKIECIIDTRLIGEAEPLMDEKALIQEYQNRKREGPLELYEI